MDSCPLCGSQSFSDPKCPTCHNITTYRTRETKKELETVPSPIPFPGPGRVLHSPIYGNYVIASRRIEEGEVIIRESPILVSCYGPSSMIPMCLSCHKDIALSAKCSKCRWPVCNDECEKDPCHSENECPILSKAGVRPKGVVDEYFSLESLRCLLLRRQCSWKWKRIMTFESHIKDRKGCGRAKQTLKFITNFIREKCNLGDEFDEEVVDRVVGVLSVNTFWTFKDLGRYSSALFDKVTIFCHDCDPNTNWKLRILTSDLDDKKDCFGFGMEVTAARTILPGEMITIRYVDLSMPVKERRAELLELFYFSCTCARCLQEMMGEVTLELESKEVEINGCRTP